MTAIRKDIARLGAVWNPTALWYAKAVAALSTKPINDRTSWRYLGAIHGVDLSPNGWVGHGLIKVTDSLPPTQEQDSMWDQCQHASWYFLPWHRGYLNAFEAIVAKAISDLGGPADWTLPYWNYFDTSNPASRQFPQAFVEPTLPDGSINPLLSPNRTAGQVLGPVPAIGLPDITSAAISRTRFTRVPGIGGFGGSPSGFAQFAPNGGAGALESDPHNLVHVMVGGVGANPGYMSDPDYAALDPLFWLHHCNIDRLWAAWLTQSGNTQENSANWRGGPTPRQFQMPRPDGTLMVFLPSQTLPGEELAPDYDDLTAGTGLPVAVGAQTAATHISAKESKMPASLSDSPVPLPQLRGSNQQALTISATPGLTRIRLAPSNATPASAEAERLYLTLENVRGVAPSGVLSVYVGLPAGGQAPTAPAALAQTVALFGLAKASRVTSAHAGNGLSLSIDITDLARSLAIASQSALAELEVRIEQPGQSNTGSITVDKVSVVSQAAD